PLPARLPIDLAECFPKPHRPIANGQSWPLRQPSALEVEEQVLPGRLALQVAIPEAQQFFLATGVSTNNDQNTMPRFLQPGLQVHAINPEIDVVFAREVPLLPPRQFVLPPLLQSAQRGRGQPR